MVTASSSEALDTARKLIDALNKDNFATARSLLSDDMKFVGVMGKRDGADAYMEDMKKMRLKYKIEQEFDGEGSACFLYELDMSGKKIRGCGIYGVDGGKVNRIEAIFDPRPLLEEKK